MLLLCPEPRVRYVIAELLLHVITAVAPHEREMYQAPLHENGDHPSLVCRIFTTLLTMMDDVRKYWANMPQYFTLLGAFANISPHEWHWFGKTASFGLGLRRERLAGAEATAPCPGQMGGWATPNCPALSCMHLYVLGSGPQHSLSKYDQMILNSEKFWKLA